MGTLDFHQDAEPESMQSAMAFYKEFVAKVLQHGGTLDEMATWLEECTHSSAFSGIAAPETALLCLHVVIQAHLPEREVLAPA